MLARIISNNTRPNVKSWLQFFRILAAFDAFQNIKPTETQHILGEIVGTLSSIKVNPLPLERAQFLLRNLTEENVIQTQVPESG